MSKIHTEGPSFASLNLISSWMNLILYAIEVVLASYFFSRFSASSRRRFHYLCVAMLVNDTVCTLVVCAATWMAVAPSGRAEPHAWIIATIIISNAVSALIEQGVLIFRLCNLSGSKLICAPLAFLMFTHAGFALGSGILMTMGEADIQSTVATVAICSSAFINFLIPILVIWYLRKIKTIVQSAQSIIRQFSVNSMSSGCFTAILEILLLVLFWLKSPALVVVSNCIGRVYSITVVVNFLVGKRMSNSLSSSNRRHPTADLTTSLGLDSLRDPNLSFLALSSSQHSVSDGRIDNMNSGRSKHTIMPHIAEEDVGGKFSYA